jgi:hypothetical protein
MFDISKLDTLSLSQEGVEMPVVNPRTKEPVRGSDGKVITITLLGKNSDVARAAMRRISDRASERAMRGIKSTPEDRERDDTEFLASVTRHWTFTEMDGQSFPCTAENATRLWSDPRLRHLREQALGFVLDDGNFLRD